MQSNVTDNSLIEKRILHPGIKNIDFKNGSKVHFHFQTRLCNKEHTLLDDSRHMGEGKPFQLILGKKFKLEVWEAVVQLMALNEVAAFTVNKKLVPEYPVVSKTLRDLDKPKHERRSNCCAMKLQTEGIGYKDLDELIKNPCDLEFTIELVKVEAPDSYEKDTWLLNEDEKLEVLPNLKQTGNNCFQNKDYQQAAEHYAKAIGIIEQLMLKEKPHSDEWNNLDQMKVPLLLNYSQCKLIEGDYYAVIEHCTTVLKTDPNNVKAYFRRAKAHVKAWNPEKATEDFQKVITLDATLNHLVQKELAALNVLIKAKNDEDKAKLKGMFK